MKGEGENLIIIGALIIGLCIIMAFAMGGISVLDSSQLGDVTFNAKVNVSGTPTNETDLDNKTIVRKNSTDDIINAEISCENVTGAVSDLCTITSGGSSVYTDVDNHFIINASSDTVGFNDALLNSTANTLIDNRVTESFITNLGFILESTVNSYFSTNFTYFENKINGLNNLSMSEVSSFINSSGVAYMNTSNSGNITIESEGYSATIPYFTLVDRVAGFFTNGSTNWVKLGGWLYALEVEGNAYFDDDVGIDNSLDVQNDLNVNDAITSGSITSLWGQIGSIYSDTWKTNITTDVLIDGDITANDYKGLWYGKNYTGFNNTDYINEVVAGINNLSMSDIEAKEYINESEFNNDTIIRKDNTTWIKENQDYNTSQEMFNAIDNGTFLHINDPRYNNTLYIEAVNDTLQAEILNRINEDIAIRTNITQEKIWRTTNETLIYNLINALNSSMLSITLSNTNLIIALTLESRNNDTLIRNEINQINISINANGNKILELNQTTVLINNTLRGIINFSNHTDVNFSNGYFNNIWIYNNLTVYNDVDINGEFFLGNSTDAIIYSNSGENIFATNYASNNLKLGTDALKDCIDPLTCLDHIAEGDSSMQALTTGAGCMAKGVVSAPQMQECYYSTFDGYSTASNINYSEYNYVASAGSGQDLLGHSENNIRIGYGFSVGAEQNDTFYFNIPSGGPDDTPIFEGVQDENINFWLNKMSIPIDNSEITQGASDDVGIRSDIANARWIYNTSRLGAGFGNEFVIYGDDDDKTLLLEGLATVYDNDYQDLTDKTACNGNPQLANMNIDELPSNFWKRDFIKNNDFPEPIDDPWVCFAMEINSEYKEGSDFEVYLHLEDDDVAGCDVVAEVEITCANQGTTFLPATIFNAIGSFPILSPSDHLMIPMGIYAGAGLDISHICNVVVKRVASDPRDTCPLGKKVFFATIERRFEENTLGSRLPYNK